MAHRYSIGSDVYYQARHGNHSARGTYKIVQQLPVENDNRIVYRIKNSSESFERIADEEQLSRTPY